MKKMYVKNGETKMTLQCGSKQEAALVMARHILKNKIPAAIFITVTQRGFMDDLVEFDMKDELDDALLFLTSEYFQAVAEENADDIDTFCEYMEASIFMTDRETEEIQKETQIGDLISELCRP